MKKYNVDQEYIKDNMRNPRCYGAGTFGYKMEITKDVRDFCEKSDKLNDYRITEVYVKHLPSNDIDDNERR